MAIKTDKPNNSTPRSMPPIVETGYLSECVGMFTAAIFTAAKGCQQPSGPWADEGLHDMGSVPRRESGATSRGNRENAALSERGLISSDPIYIQIRSIP